MNVNERWHVIDEAPNYRVSNNGYVKFGNGTTARSLVRTRRTWFGRKYVNILIKGRVKRFYIDRLVTRYFPKG